jgi:hypothetical protein
MITLADYWQGRDALYPLAMSPQIERNALLTVELANKLLERAKAAGVVLSTNPKTGTAISSGWRPPVVNAATPKASPTSRHMTGQAVDLYDPAGLLDAWAYSQPQVLKDLGVWLEHFSATPGWLHAQTVPPGSGNRYFFP